MKGKVTITGVDDVNNLLGQIAPREAGNIMRATIHGVAGQIRDDAKAAMPEDEGTMKKATRARREKVRFGRIASSVLVTRAAFYWRFLEYGQGPGGVEYAMFAKASEKFRAKMNEIFLTQFGKKWEAALVRAAKRNGR